MILHKLCVIKSNLCICKFEFAYIYKVDGEENYLCMCNILSIFTLKSINWKQRRAKKGHKFLGYKFESWFEGENVGK